ncbi:MAG: hypothetical protein AVDCRST_MAG31-448, partial [uncultured Sphingomonas sp.]
ERTDPGTPGQHRGRRRAPRLRAPPGPAERVGLLRRGARGGRGDGASLHGGGGGRAVRPRRRHAALPVPLHAGRLEAPGPSAARARDGARRGPQGPRARPGAAAVRRRQVLRRAHGVAGPGRPAAAGPARAGVPRLSAAPRQEALGRARRAPRPRGRPDALPARHARRAGRDASAHRDGPAAGGARHPRAPRPGRPLLPCAGEIGSERRPSPRRGARRDGGLDGRRAPTTDTGASRAGAPRGL